LRDQTCRVRLQHDLSQQAAQRGPRFVDVGLKDSIEVVQPAPDDLREF
jgi:hypothetical protein